MPRDSFYALVPTYVPRECALHPEQVRELDPCPENVNVETLDAWLLENAQADMDAMQVPKDYRDEAYRDSFSASPNTKVGGFPVYVQDPDVLTCECGQDMTYLLTMCSEIETSPASRGRWEGSDVPRRGGDEYTEFRNRTATELVLGDMGCVYVFECRRCPQRPTGSFLQCA